MSRPVSVLLVTHRGFGEGLLTAAESILGRRPEVSHLSNEGLSPEALGEAIDTWLREQAGPALILTDLGFGSCCQTARRVSRDRDTVGILAGVNLPILLAVVRSGEQDDFRAFLEHLRHRGQGSLELYLGGERL